MTTTNMAPLPLAYYFASDARDSRRKLFSPNALGYAGTERMVPNAGDYRVMEQFHDAYMLLRDPKTSDLRLLSNVCRHKQALIVDPKRKEEVRAQNDDLVRRRTGNITALPRERFYCPVHRWGYDAGGKHCAAPHFPKETRIDLPVRPLSSWNGFLFCGRDEERAALLRSLGEVGHSGLFDPKMLDLTDYKFFGLETYRYDFSAETMIEVYLDLNHDPYHQKTFLEVVDWNNLKWEFGERYSIQVIPWKPLSGPGITEKYRLLRKEIGYFYRDQDPPHGALWMLIYPNIMIEWYPMAIVVSTVYPDGDDLARSINHVEYYLRNDRAFRGAFDVQRAAYDETASEDEEICNSIERGRRAEWRLGESAIGPTHPVRELGVAHFHEYIRRTSGLSLA